LKQGPPVSVSQESKNSLALDTQFSAGSLTNSLGSKNLVVSAEKSNDQIKNDQKEKNLGKKLTYIPM
jgi:hypothetical protein